MIERLRIRIRGRVRLVGAVVLSWRGVVDRDHHGDHGDEGER
jgi:hypothetical protein